jgi:hypothetical protein
MKRIPTLLGLTATALLGFGALAAAQIVRLDLRKMIASTDNAVYGTITGREVIRIDHPVDGPGLFYTTLTVEGTSLLDDKPVTVDVTFPGGFITDTEGVWNSEAPSADDIKTGNKVVVFYKWVENMGGDLAANALYGSHGGLFRTQQTRKGVVVQGRGEGYAIDQNVELSKLSANAKQIRESLPKNK